MKSKFISLALCAVLSLGLVSCGSSSSSSVSSSVSNALAGSTTSQAGQAGSSCGTSLKNLYTNYKAAGKLDMSNTSNILNLATLAASAAEIKENYKDKTFYKDFAAGLLQSAVSLVTTSNVDSTISSLANIDLSGFTSGNAASTVSSVASTANAVSQVTNLLSSFKK